MSYSEIQGLTIPLPALAVQLGQPLHSAEWLAGDGSDRKYYRLRSQDGQGSWIVMQLSASEGLLLKDNEYLWVQLCFFLREYGIKTPEISHIFSDFSALLIEDCGDMTLESAVTASQKTSHFSDIRKLYQPAWEILSSFLHAPACGAQRWYQRCFDQKKLREELDFFEEHLLLNHLKMTLTQDRKAAFEAECQELSQFLGAQPHYLVHRDFHSRNLMLKDDQMTVIDFQDARPGPASYDLVSLCFDPYVDLSREERRTLFHDALSILGGRFEEDVLASWEHMKLQRLYKAMGSYGYLSQIRPEINWSRYLLPVLEMLRDTGLGSRFPFLSEELPDLICKHLEQNKESFH